MPGETEIRRGIANAGVHIVHIRRVGGGKGHPMAGKAQFLQRFLENCQRAAVFGCHAGATDEGAGQIERVGSHMGL